MLALIAILAAAQTSPFCTALQAIIASAQSGFVTVRGPVDTAAHASAFDTYRARIALPDATGCSVTVPHSPGLGPPSYTCDFSGGLDVGRAMGRLARRTARCAHVGIGNPPRFSPGPAFMFDNGTARFDFSAAKVDGRPGLWTLTLAVTRGPKARKGPRA